MTQAPEPASGLAGGRLTIDLAALRANWKALAGHVAGGGHATAAVVKGDGYGTGLEQAATALAAAGCTTFFVALPGEGLRLRTAVPGAVVYVLDGLIGDAGRLCGRRPPAGARLMAGDRGVAGLPQGRRHAPARRSMSIPA